MAHEEKHIHNRLRKHRKMMRYSLKEVAWLLNLKSTNRLSRWEQGLSRPSVKNLLKLGIIYRALTDQLYQEYRRELQIELTEREKTLQETKLKSGKHE